MKCKDECTYEPDNGNICCADCSNENCPNICPLIDDEECSRREK